MGASESITKTTMKTFSVRALFASAQADAQQVQGWGDKRGRLERPLHASPNGKQG